VSGICFTLVLIQEYSHFALPCDYASSPRITAKRYEPFEHMWAPYQAEKESLYLSFGPADRLLVFKRIFMADTMYAGPAKVC